MRSAAPKKPERIPLSLKSHTATDSRTDQLCPRRIWMVTEIYHPEDTSTGHYVTGIAEGLAKDRPVSVLCGFPSYARRHLPAPSREERAGVRIFRCKASLLARKGFFSGLVNAVSSTLLLSVSALRLVDRGSHLLVGTNPPLLPFLILIVARIKRCRLTVRVDDVYPEAMAAAGVISATGVVWRSYNFLNRLLYKACFRLIVVGRDMAEVVSGKLESSAPEVIFIPNWSDTTEILPADSRSNQLRNQLGLGESLVIGYAGNMGPVQGIAALLDGIKTLRDSPDVHFVFIGSGKLFPLLARTVQEEGLTNVTILPHFPREQQNDFLNLFDVGIVSLGEGMYGVGVPSRCYNLMAAGRPILALVEKTSEIGRIVEEEMIGWVVAPGDLKGFHATVIALGRDLAELKSMGRRARLAAELKYSKEIVVSTYRKLAW